MTIWRGTCWSNGVLHDFSSNFLGQVFQLLETAFEVKSIEKVFASQKMFAPESHRDCQHWIEQLQELSTEDDHCTNAIPALLTAPGYIRLTAKKLQKALEKLMDDNFGSPLTYR